MRKSWLVGSGLVLLAAMVAIGTVWRVRAGPAAHEEKSVVTLTFTPAEVVTPVMAPMPERVEFSGALEAPRTAVVRAKTAGTLLALTVAEGSRVRAGQSLGRIDLSDLQSRSAERAAGVDSAQARLTEAERIYRSNRDLADQHFISTNALESSRAALEAARAQLKSTQAQYATAVVGIRDAALVAPIDGVVGKRDVVPGEKVSAEQALLTIVDLRQLELSGVVGTAQVSLLRPGQALAVQVEGSAEAVPGRIDRIAPMAEAGTRGIRVVVQVPNADERFRAGQYASAVVTIGDAAPRLTVPTTAVGQTSGQDFVWTLEHGKLVRRLVITGRSDAKAGRIEVRQGLAPDAQVIAARFDALQEGTPAWVLAAAGGSATPATLGATNVEPAASAPVAIPVASPAASPATSPKAS